MAQQFNIFDGSTRRVSAVVLELSLRAAALIRGRTGAYGRLWAGCPWKNESAHTVKTQIREQ